MAVNAYDRATDAPIINTYVPIDFNQLYRIGQTQKEDVDQAAKELQATVQTYGQFQSPSMQDTKNYYNQSIGRISDLIEEAAANPDAMKDTSFRQRLQSRINNLDYAQLANYRQSAENLAQRQKVVAQMQSEGRYNPNWDNINISNWDTSKQGIMTDLSPVRYMTANELSNQYFDNMRPGALGQVTRNGVRYNLTGNSYKDLESIATAHYNDLINTPQGQQYYNQLLRQNNGDQAAARNAFTTMIANSQIDRTLRPQEEVDPLWMLQARKSLQEPKVVQTMPTRLDFINNTITKTNTQNLGNIQTQTAYRNYINSLIGKYGANSEIGKNATKGVKNIDNLMNSASNNVQLYNQYVQQYNKTGDDRYTLAAKQAEYKATIANAKVQGLATKYTMLNEFKKAAGFDAFNKQPGIYGTQDYLNGVNRALDNIKSKISISTNDALLTGIGGQPFEIQDKDTGTKHNVFQFNDSKGILLPETVFQAFTSTSPRQIKREAGSTRSTDFPAKELLESGNINNLQFIPDGSVTKLGNNVMVSGKIRIPKKEVEDKLGTGTWDRNGTIQPNMFTSPQFFSRERTSSALKNMFGAQKVSEAIGSDGVDYYEMQAFKTLPSEQTSPEYWQTVNQRWQNSQTGGGIGGSTQAKEAYMGSAEQTLND